MKILTTLVLVALLAPTAMAQEGFRFGLKGGPQSSWMFNSDDSDDADWLYVHTIRPLVGVSAGYNFTPGVGLQMDVLYSAQGQKYTFDDDAGDRQLSYLKIPVLLNLNTVSEATTFAYLNVGPQFGILLNSSISQETDFLSLTNIGVSGAYQTLNIGAVLAFGAGFNLNEFLQLTTGIRLDFAFTDAEDKDSILFALTPDRAPTYNATGAFEVGVRYVIRKGD